MQLILTILSYVLVALNLGAPPKVSNMSSLALMAEHTAVILLCAAIIKRQFRERLLRRRYNLFFLAGYCVSLLFLYSEWGQSLVKDYALDFSTFDPIKYYSMAAESIKTGTEFEGMTMFPVAYVWYFVMGLLGMDPLVPLFVNEVAFVYAVCILAKFVNGGTPQHLGYYSWLLVIPEVAVFNVTSSKDILCLLCATILFVKTAEIVRRKYSLAGIGVIAVAFTVFALARTSLAMASICGVMLMVIFSRRFSKRVVALSCIGLCMAVAVFTITGNMDSTAEDVAEKVGTELTGDVSEAAELNGQSSNSFARRLVPHNSVEFVAFGFVRSVCYVVLDPRFVTAPLRTLLPLDGLTMHVMVDYTTLLMFIACFFILVWLRKDWKAESRAVKDTFMVAMMYWYAVGTFNPLMIHVRYRLVYDLLFFAIAIRAFARYKERHRPYAQRH